MLVPRRGGARFSSRWEQLDVSFASMARSELEGVCGSGGCAVLLLRGTSSRSPVHVCRPVRAGVWGVGCGLWDLKLLCASCVVPRGGRVASFPLDAGQGPL